MDTDFALKLLVGILPVICFLAGLVYLDSYKLVGWGAVWIAIGTGATAAGVGFLLNVTVLESLGITRPVLLRYVAPPLEELLKGAVLFYLLSARRIGFLVDAAILGFAIGAGFGLVENLYYLETLRNSNMAVWVVRGFGTAIMHGGATAILGIVSKTLTERWESTSPLLFLPGFLIATAVHSLFNHFFLAPVISAAAVLLGLPPLILVVYGRSEAALERWLGVGFDSEAELIRLIQSGDFSNSRVGRYLQSLRDRFRGEVLADMLCYLRLRAELGLKAKGLLLMREAGFETAPDPELRAVLDELTYLERSIGVTGRLAILPFVRRSDRDSWQLRMLRGAQRGCSG